MFVCFFKQKTAYEMRISDWSSDVCSSDLVYPYGEISLALRQAVIDAGFAGAFGQHSGAAGGSADRFALPRFPLNEAYGALDRFRLLANALPLPVSGVTPSDTAIDRKSTRLNSSH